MWPRIIICWLALGGVAARAWSPPVMLSSASSGSEPSVPRVCAGASGRVLVTWRQKPEWRIFYRQRGADGQWSPATTISSVFSDRPDVIEDSAGSVHVVYVGRGAADQLDLLHAVNTGGNWSTSPVMSTSQSEDYPRLGVDSAGRLHMAYTRTSSDAAHNGGVYYRSYTDGTWSGEALLGSIASNEYHRLDLCVDPSDAVHVVWAPSITTAAHRKLVSGAWTPQQTIGTGAFVSFTKIAAISATHVACVWHDEANNTKFNVWTASTDGGASWSTQQTLGPGHYPNMDARPGTAHVVFQGYTDTSQVLYRAWNGSAWTATDRVNPGEPNWKGWMDVGADAGGHVHVVYDDVLPGDQHQIAYVTNAPAVPPPPPLAFTATPAHNQVALSWTNPSAPDHQRTIVRASTVSYPASPTDGAAVCDRSAAPGSSDSFVHTGVVNGTHYYYAAFARNSSGVYSAAATASATPYVPADFDRDGDVDQADFGRLQRCLAGPGIIPATECASADLTGDFDVDQVDFDLFVSCYSGPLVAYLPACAD